VVTATIYIDESGDLGWSFEKPYGNGGSSRFLTICAVVVTSDDLAHLPGRLVRDMYKAHKWPTNKEKKWTGMSNAARLDFAKRATVMVAKHPGIKLYAMTVQKQNVAQHLREDPNLLYNYMLKLMLLEEMAEHDEVILRPDPRTIKVQSGNTQHEYLQTVLWYDQGARTKLHSEPIDSGKELGIQFADMLAGVIQTHHQAKRSAPWQTVAKVVRWKPLFFPTC
jgi:hypothetical protein